MKKLIVVYAKILRYFVYISMDFEERYSKNARDKKIGMYGSKELYHKI